jgi:hypothetical protein
VITAIVAACIAAPIIVLLFVPRDSLVRWCASGEWPRKWHLETVVVGGISALIVAYTGHHWVEWVFWSGGVFAHGSQSVGRRLHEAQARVAREMTDGASAGGRLHAVECWRAGRRYSYGARGMFAVGNVALGFYGALTSSVISTAYDLYREWYTGRRDRRAS